MQFCNIYKDHPHKIIFVRNRASRFVKKSVEDKVVQRKEFNIQKILYKTTYVPKCFQYNNAFFLEQFIEGTPLSEVNNINDRHIIELANILKKIHNPINIDDCLNIFQKEELKKEYDPEKVLTLVLPKDKQKIISQSDYELIKYAGSSLKEEIKNIDYKMSIVHGDLNSQNIIISKEGLKIIDWTDSRVDVGMVDIVQFIHLSEINEEQKKLLLKEYKHGLNIPFFVDFLLLMHAAYDYNVNYLNKKLTKKNSELLDSAIANIRNYL